MSLNQLKSITKTLRMAMKLWNHFATISRTSQVNSDVVHHQHLFQVLVNWRNSSIPKVHVTLNLSSLQSQKTLSKNNLLVSRATLLLVWTTLEQNFSATQHQLLPLTSQESSTWVLQWHLYQNVGSALKLLQFLKVATNQTWTVIDQYQFFHYYLKYLKSMFLMNFMTTWILMTY